MKKVLFIVLSVLVVLFTMIFIGVNFNKDNDKTFIRSGYVLNNEKNSGNKTDSTNTVKYYFNEETNYKNSYDDSVEFKDTNGNKVKVMNTSFIHYNDDSISLLKKGVVFNLDEIGNKIPKYYNLFESTVLEYKNESYIVDNLGKQLKFKNFIVKTSKEKYLIISNNIKLKLDGETESSIKSNYVEISYVDENVIRIENQESIYQTISDKATVEIGNDLSLNLSNGYFFYKGEKSINLEQITIDSDDNIDITPLEEKENEEETDESDNQNNSNNGVGDGENENSDDSISNSTILEEEVDEDSLVLPTASITDMVVTANKIDCSVVIEDKSNIVTGSSYTTVVENSTGKVVWAKEEPEGTYNISVFSEALVPNTTYSLTTTISYMKNELEYTMDVIQQIFVTETIGVNIEKNYFSSDTLSFRAIIDSYSSAKSAIISLIDTSGEVVSTIPVNAELAKSEEGQIVTFENLNANTKYSVRVDNIFYDNDILADDFSLEISAKTLKKRPIIGKVSFDIDKKNSLFTLKLNDMEDLDNGAESYKFEIYDARTLANGSAPITTIEKKSLSSVDLPIDNSIILRGVPYVFRVAIEFYDNEKYIEYYSSYSNNMQMDGVESPSISWKSDNVTFESITGTITVNDPRNTIDYSKNMTIVYTNSIGTTLSYTAQGNTIIPFSRNNLRANETYTISLYATVDLQDGNAPVDMFHVGSVAVLTNPTNPFEMSLNHLTDDVSTTFTIQARLTSAAGIDTELEASTLTGLTFYLYEGKSAVGTPYVTSKKVDRDLREYYSDLKENYYDSTFLINPGFFGKAASDLTSDYYTIVVESAYDYTDFKNNIPINNNVITIKSNGYTPDAPADADNAIDYEFIYNKDAGEKYDPNLDATTIVGVRVKAKYDNARRYAIAINYHCYDAITMEKIDSAEKTFSVGSDGVIDYVTYWFGTGTSQSVQDDTLVRGHRYFFSYDAALDLDKDGTAETRYPKEIDKLYRSEFLDIKKQEPTIKMYPSLSTSTTLTVKYVLKDYDHALYGNMLYLEESTDGINYELVNSQKISSTDDLNTFRSVKFDGLYAGYFNIYSKTKLIKDDEVEPTVKNYISQKFLVNSSLGNINYDIEAQVNRINVIIKNYEANRSQVDRITALKVTFGCEGKTVVEDFVKLDANIATVDTFALSEFIGKDVTVSVEAYYDTNVFGFDVKSKYVALQTVFNTASSVGEYISINDLNRVVFSTEGASGSIFDKSLNDNKYGLTNKLSGYSLDFPFKVSEDGIRYDFNPVLFKEIALATLIPDGNSSFRLTQIVPGITLKENSESYNISPSITSVEFKAAIKGFSSESNIKDDKIYVKISSTDDGMNLTHVKTCEFTLSDFSDILTIDGLVPKKTYAMEFFANVSNSSGDYTYSKLYDLDDNTENPIYYFITNSSLGFSETSAKYVAVSYNDKYIYFRYDIDKVTGYDYLSFKIYKAVYNEEIGADEYQLVDINIDDEYSLKKSMALSVPCNPGSVFEFGQKYRLEITANVVSNINGETRVIELDNPGQIDFKLNKLASPYIGIGSSVSNDGTDNGNSINFRVNFYDKDKAVVDGKYTVSIINKSNGKDVTPDKYKGYLFSIKNYNTQFTIDNVDVGSTYTLNVYYSVDMNNDVVSSIDKYSFRDAVAYSSNDINVGSITAVANTQLPNKIDLQFKNSYRITEINRYMYSIYNSLDGTSVDSNGYVDFMPDKFSVGDVFYYQLTLPETLSASGYYYVQLQFLNKNNDVVADSTVEYIYNVVE